jgi:hypothetical protein
MNTIPISNTVPKVVHIVDHLGSLLRGGMMADDYQYSKQILACDPRIRGTAICHLNGRCSVCIFAYRYEHPEEPVLNISKVG